MKNYTLLFIMYAVALTGYSQNITRIEYFVDNDPGFGKAIPVSGYTLAPIVSNVNVAIDLSTVSSGVHSLYIRAKDANGKWSLTAVKPFAKYGSAIPVNITRLEYFIDSDPGFGKATPISFTPATVVSNVKVAIDLSTVSSGVHSFYVRAKDQVGSWSLVASRAFAKYGSAVPVNITRLEYFIDSDPGFGKATPISFTPATVVSNVNLAIDLSTVSSGVHSFYVRAKDQVGSWSLVASRAFAKYGSAIPVNITRLEYFIDTDPGFGLATSVPITPAVSLSGINIMADISSLSVGGHVFYIRAKDAVGSWSLISAQSFDKTLPLASQTISISPISTVTFLGSNAKVSITGSATSGLPVSYSIATDPDGIASLVGNTININNIGTVTVTGSQEGNASYNAAPTVNSVFNVVRNSVPTIVGCYFDIVLNTYSFPGTAFTKDLEINTDATWSGTTDVDWVSWNPLSESGLCDGNPSYHPFSISVVENPSSQSRTAVITFTGGASPFIFHVYQSGKAATVIGVPSVTGIVSNTPLASGSSAVITINGNGFANGSIVSINGVALNTQFLSSNALLATVPSGLITTNNPIITVSVPGVGSSAITSPPVTVVPVTAVNSNLLENDVKIYPNPSNGSFIIELITRQTEFTISSIDGKLLLKDKLIKGANYLETKLSKGIYLISIEGLNRKLIVE